MGFFTHNKAIIFGIFVVLYPLSNMPISNLTLKQECLDDIDIPVFIKNTEGIYIFCNNAFVDFLGLPKNKILGQMAHDIAPKKLADAYVAADKDLLEYGKNQIYDSHVQANNAKTAVTFNKTLLYTRQHDVTGFIGTINIHTETQIGDPKKLNTLTEREREVLILLLKGLSTKGIANMLGISHHTSADHLKSIYRKLEAHSKNEALYKALTLFAISP